MTLEDELRIKKLICESENCDTRIALDEVFGYELAPKCPLKNLIRALYERDMAAEHNAKHRLEYPDEAG
jgi:hypothetical protein